MGDWEERAGGDRWMMGGTSRTCDMKEQGSGTDGRR